MPKQKKEKKYKYYEVKIVESPPKFYIEKKEVIISFE